MKKFILGIMIFLYGAVGSMITYVYTLLNPVISNGKENWIVYFVENDTALPFLIFLIIMTIGIVICVQTFEKSQKEELDEDFEEEMGRTQNRSRGI